MKRLIEQLFPVEAISASCKREKSIRQGHISTLQTWWARRPLAVCRATVFLSLLPSLEVLARNDNVVRILNDRYPNIDGLANRLSKFVSELSDFENSSNSELISIGRHLISLTNTNPSLADTFSGGGSIPLEAIRLGAKTFASDLNPIAATGLKLALTYAPRASKKAMQNLLDDIEYVGKSLHAQLHLNYPDDADLAYFWAKTYTCPHCQRQTPLFQNKWLSKTGQLRAFKINKLPTAKNPQFSIYEPASEADKTDADTGTVASKSASCIFCNGSTATDEIQRQGVSGLLREFQYAKLTKVDGERVYVATAENISREISVSADLPCPDGACVDLSLPLDLNGIRHLWAIQYGIRTVADLFNPRQACSIQAITKIILNHWDHIKKSSATKKEAQFRYLGLIMIMNKVAIYSNRHSWWQSNGAFPANIFVRQAISMVWNYVEIPPTSLGAGGWHSSSKWVIKALEHIQKVDGEASVAQSDAAKTAIPSNALDLVVIDPPYFDSITYAYLSDFFYPWMKVLLRSHYPDWFSPLVTPKEQELIVDRKHKLAPSPKSGQFFAEKMTACLIEARRTLTPNGIVVLMYGHKELHAWVALFKAIKSSGLRVTVSWPIHTERKSKFKHSRVDALGISCVLVLRPVVAPSPESATTIQASEFRAQACNRLEELKVRHPELNEDDVALSMAVFPLVLDDFMHTTVVDSDGNIQGIEQLLDSVNL